MTTLTVHARSVEALQTELAKKGICLPVVELGRMLAEQNVQIESRGVKRFQLPDSVARVHNTTTAVPKCQVAARLGASNGGMEQHRLRAVGLAPDAVTTLCNDNEPIELPASLRWAATKIADTFALDVAPEIEKRLNGNTEKFGVRPFSLEFKQSRGKGSWWKLRAEPTGGGRVRIQVTVSKDAATSTPVVAEIETFIHGLLNKSNGFLSSPNPFLIVELLTNAQEGSPAAALALQQVRVETLEYLTKYRYHYRFKKYGDEFVSGTRVLEHIEARLSSERERLRELEEAHAANHAQRVARYEARLTTLKERDARRPAAHLIRLLEVNDRSQIAALLRDYLPWELLEPVETRHWQRWMEAVANPLADHHRQVLFRGLSKIDHGNVCVAHFLGFAASDSLYDILSRAYRSLFDGSNEVITGIGERFRVQNAAAHVAGSVFHHKSASIHRAGTGSPFISLTASPRVAADFGAASGRLAVYLVDSRLANPTIASDQWGELEWLATLFLFADDRVDTIDTRDYALSTVEQALARRLGDADAKRLFESQVVPAARNPWKTGERAPSEYEKQCFAAAYQRFFALLS